MAVFIFLAFFGGAMFLAGETLVGAVLLGVGVFGIVYRVANGPEQPIQPGDYQPPIDPSKQQAQAWNDLRREQYAQSSDAARYARIRQNMADGVAYCPYCGSSSLSANRRGYAVGRGFLFGPLFGMVGMNKVKVTCLNCGRQFKPGKKF